MDRLQSLTELLPLLRQWMDEAPVDKRSPLVAQYRAALAEVAELSPAEQTGDAVDEIARRRDARRSGATQDQGRTKRKG